MTSLGQRIPIKTRREIALMHEAGRHVAEILEELEELVAPGITTLELDRFAEKKIQERGVVSSFKGYDPYGLPPYPGVICVSVTSPVMRHLDARKAALSRDLMPAGVVKHWQVLSQVGYGRQLRHQMVVSDNRTHRRVKVRGREFRHHSARWEHRRVW